MKLKQRIEDFRVRELLCDDVLQERGEYRVYRVTKRKMTSLEAARVLGDELGVSPGEIGMAGLKDRQGITVQYMSVHQGRACDHREPQIRIESVGFSADHLSSRVSEGNGFELCLRELDRSELEELRRNVPLVRESGLVNYFDEQRFGNLRHDQGWIFLDLLRGRYEQALRTLLCGRSPHDGDRSRALKFQLGEAWRDWDRAREVAGRFGEHHSIFEHLQKKPDDFAGAFYHVATRIRLIHLYAYQSHLWNRAVVRAVREVTPLEDRVLVDTWEGPLLFTGARDALVEAVGENFRLPGPRLEDVTHDRQRELLTAVLADDGIEPEDFDVQGVPGFQLKGEDRPLVVVPRHLRVRPAEPDRLNRGCKMVKLRFELPRGSYASLVARRMVSTVVGSRAERAAERADSSRGLREGVSGHREAHREILGGSDAPPTRWAERGDDRGSDRGDGNRGRGRWTERGDDRGSFRGGGRGGERPRGDRGVDRGAPGGFGGRRGEGRDRGQNEVARRGGYRGDARRDDRGHGRGGAGDWHEGGRGRGDRGRGHSGGGVHGEGRHGQGRGPWGPRAGSDSQRGGSHRDDRGWGGGGRARSAGGEGYPDGGVGHRGRRDRGHGEGPGRGGWDSRAGSGHGHGRGGHDDRRGSWGGSGQGRDWDAGRRSEARDARGGDGGHRGDRAYRGHQGDRGPQGERGRGSGDRRGDRGGWRGPDDRAPGQGSDRRGSGDWERGGPRRTGGAWNDRDSSRPGSWGRDRQGGQGWAGSDRGDREGGREHRGRGGRESSRGSSRGSWGGDRGAGERGWGGGGARGRDEGSFRSPGRRPHAGRGHGEGPDSRGGAREGGPGARESHGFEGGAPGAPGARWAEGESPRPGRTEAPGRPSSSPKHSPEPTPESSPRTPPTTPEGADSKPKTPEPGGGDAPKDSKEG